MAKDLSAQIEITADATGVETGVGRAKRSLSDLGATASAAGKNASAGLQQMGKGGAEAAGKIDAATRNMIGSIQRTTAALDAGGRSSSDYFRLLASQRGINVDALNPYLTALDAVAAKQTVAGAAVAKGAIQFNQYGISAKQTAAALRQVPAQLTDIFVSLQGGQAPLTVLLQQGGQLKDIFGGIRPAAAALGNALLGLINPFTVTAAVIGGLALAYKMGSAEADAYAKAIILSGNAAGTSVGQLQSMAVSISKVVGTQGAAAAALAQFAASGDIAASSIERFATVAIKLERTTGQAIGETVKQFASLAKEPVAASIKLNETTRFLTLSLYQQIKALEDQGRTADAAAAAQKGYADAMESRTGELIARLGLVERAWTAIADEAKKGWDQMLNIGRPSNLQSQLKEVDDLIARQRTLGIFDVSAIGIGPNAADLSAKRAALLESIRLERQGTDAVAAGNRQIAARRLFDKAGEQFLTNQAKFEREVTEARNEGTAAGASQIEIEKRVAAIRAKYADKPARKPREDKSGLGLDRAQLQLDLAAIQAAGDELLGSYTNSERVLESLRSAGLLGDKEYYDAKLAFINLESAAQEDALQKRIARLRQEDLQGKERLDNEREIAREESRLAILRARSAADTTILATQQEAALKRLEAAYLTARQAAQDYFDTTQRQQTRELDGIGKGSQQRGRDAGISQIEDRFNDQRRQLENRRSLLQSQNLYGADAKKQYDNELALIREFQGKSIASFTDYYATLVAKQLDFANGANEAMANYLTGVQDVAGQTQELFTSAFQGIEDALVTFVSTGKLSFKDLANSIVQDINRIIIKQNITGPLAEMIQGGFRSGEGVGGWLKDFLGPLLGSGRGIATNAGNPAEAAAGIAAASTIAAAQAAAAATIAAANTAAETAAATAIVTAIGTSTAAIVTAISASAASGAASSGLGSMFDLVDPFAFASGGRPPMGRVSLVGEAGPELFIPDTPGRILSHGDSKALLAPSAPRPINVTINQAFASNATRTTVDQAAAEAGRAVRRSLARGTA